MKNSLFFNQVNKVMALVFVCCGLSTMIYGGEKLPKILVAEDGRSFRTEDGKPFVPFGVNYFRTGTGWAPQIWKTFDEAAFRADFKLMQEAGVNCVRVFLTYGSFLTEKDKVNPEGLAKFDKLLEIAEDYGIYIHPTGPDHWEGPGVLGAQKSVHERYSDDEILRLTTMFWKVFAARYKGRNAIFAYDLLNEPEIPWDASSMKPKWNKWLKKQYKNAKDFSDKRNIPLSSIRWGDVDAPTDLSNRDLILDYQHFREDLADHWTKIQVETIKKEDPKALVTVGLIQWSVATMLPVPLKHYAAFRPSRQAPFLDFMEVHFYPIADGLYDYEKDGHTDMNLAYVESVVREVSLTGKPVVVAEFGWIGGGKLQNSNPEAPAVTEEQQAGWNKALVETTKGLAVGWLNWGFFDMPESTDISELLGLYTSDRKQKAWGRTFKKLSDQLSGQHIMPKTMSHRPAMDWELILSDPQESPRFYQAYLAAFLAEEKNNTFYVSSSTGDDHNPGTRQKPWRTLDKISRTTFKAGETICLKRGDTFDGCATLNGAGTTEAPITLTAYGAGNRPFIKGPGGETTCLTFPESSMGWRIQGVEIGFGREGILILSGKKNSGYYFEDVYLHDVNNKRWKENWDMGNWVLWGHAIYLRGGGSVENLTLKNCIFQGNDCDFTTCDHWGDSGNNQGVGLIDILIDGCTFTEGLYNSVYQWRGSGRMSERFSITNCMFYKNGAGDMPYGTTSICAGMITGERNANLVAGNEFAYQQDSHGNDGCGFDFETVADGITFRDNFTHDCFGESILFMPGVNGNIINRRNILIEDNLFVNNCVASKHHRNEIDFIFQDGHGGDITIRNNRFIRLPDTKMIAPVPDCVVLENNVDITDEPVATPEYAFDATKNTVTLSCPDKQAVLYYTTNGSVPTRNSRKYTGQEIPITKTTVVDGKAFRDGYLPSRSCCALVAPANH
jgi:hypothetical protein